LHSFGARKLDWLRKYVFAFLVLISLLEIMFSSLRMFELAPAVIFAYQVFYVILELAVVVFIIKTAVTLFRYLTDTVLDKSKQTARYLSPFS
jgi:hypothetical protein